MYVYSICIINLYVLYCRTSQTEAIICRLFFRLRLTSISENVSELKKIDLLNLNVLYFVVICYIYVCYYIVEKMYLFLFRFSV